jgi:hypothetical protein
MKNTKINKSIRDRILISLKKGTIRATDFPELSNQSNSLNFTDEERDFINSIYERIYSNPKMLNRYSPEIKIDFSLKVRLLKSLASGFISDEALPEIHQPAAILLFSSVEERARFIEIADRVIEC